jgi:hypothetical protein
VRPNRGFPRARFTTVEKLALESHILSTTRGMSYRKRMAWFSERCPIRRKALSAWSSAADMADESREPSPLVELVYVLMQSRAWDESRAVGIETWKRLARCAVNCVSDCECAGSEGRDGCVWAPPLFPPSGGRLSAMMDGAAVSWPWSPSQERHYSGLESSVFPWCVVQVVYRALTGGNFP